MEAIRRELSALGLVVLVVVMTTHQMIGYIEINQQDGRSGVQLITFSNKNNHDEKVRQMLLTKYNLLNGTKILLYWTPFFGRTRPFSTDFEPCPDLPCVATTNQRNHKFADVIIFHGPNIKLTNLPITRFAHQRYVFFSLENPEMFALPSIFRQKFKHFFNWTMSYRLDSDFFHPYGFLKKQNWSTIPSAALKQRELWQNLVESVKTKNILVSWFVSNCYTRSGRERYAYELRKYIPVNIYGPCLDGHLNCSKREDISNNCSSTLTRQSYFYLSFENNICKDYITEKLWRRILDPVVPIVLNRSLLAPYMPADGFIAVDDFDSPKKLATYLQYLRDNSTAYLEYFKWRLTYRVVNWSRDNLSSLREYGFCQLCERLVNEKRYGPNNQSEQTPLNIYSWWQGGGYCSSVRV